MKRVLIILAGTSPAVVSLTLYALRERGWVPDALHVVTTRVGQALLQAPPVRDAQGRPTHSQTLTAVLDAMFGAPFAVVPQYHAIAQDDTDTPEATHEMTNLLARVYCEQAKVGDDHACEIHLSAAGGRKAMGWVASQVFALLARPQDRASQVLVDPVFEGDRAFYFPGQPDTFAHRQQVPGQLIERLELAVGKLVWRQAELASAQYPYQGARVQLIELPVVRMRHFLGKPLSAVIDKEAPSRFMQVIGWLDDYLSARVLVLDTSTSPAELRVQRSDGAVMLVLRAGDLRYYRKADQSVLVEMPSGSWVQKVNPPIYSLQRSHWAVLAWLAVRSAGHDWTGSPVTDTVLTYMQLLLARHGVDAVQEWEKVRDLAWNRWVQIKNSDADKYQLPEGKLVSALLGSAGAAAWPDAAALNEYVSRSLSDGIKKSPLTAIREEVNPFFGSMFQRHREGGYSHFDEIRVQHQPASAVRPA